MSKSDEVSAEKVGEPVNKLLNDIEAEKDTKPVMKKENATLLVNLLHHKLDMFHLDSMGKWLNDLVQPLGQQFKSTSVEVLQLNSHWNIHICS